MMHVLPSYMHMLTLNSEALSILVQSNLMKQLCSVCLNPQKYHRYILARRNDDFSAEQML